MKTFLKRSLVGLASVVMVSAAAGCSSGGAAGGESDGTPERGGTITVAIEAETPGWYPPNGLVGLPGHVVNRLVYGSLTSGSSDGSYVPYLAKSVTPDETFTKWTIGLRPGMKFQDGSPFDADAVKFSFDRLTEPEAAVSGVYPFFESSKVVDDETVQVDLSKPMASFPMYLSGDLGHIFSKKALQEIGPEAFNSAPVGAGPYKMTKWVRDSQVTLERSDNFFDPKAAYPDKIIVKPIPDDAARAAALRAGDVDTIVTQSAADIQSFERASDYTVEKSSYGVNGFYLNFTHDPLGDVRVRKAIDHALDKDALISLIWKGLGERWSNWFSKGNKYTVDVPTRDHDVAKAKSLVKDYVDEKGKQPSFELIAPPTATYSALSQAVKQQLAQVGISVKIGSVTDAGTLTTRIIKGDFDMAAAVMPSFLDPDYELGRFYDSTSFLNINRFKSSKLDGDIKAAQQTQDEQIRKAAYADVQEIIAENVAGIFVRQNVYGLIMKRDIHYDRDKTLGEYYTPVLPDLLWRE